MITLDLRTVYFSYVLTNLVCLLVMIFLWRQTRKHYQGTGYLVADFSLQVLALFLIFARNLVPDWLSINVANASAMIGAFMGLVGLEKLVGKPGKHYHNFAIISLFVIIHAYFTFIKPDLAVRNLNTAITFGLIAAQCVWLMWFRTQKHKRKQSFAIGLIFFIYILVNIARVVEFFVYKHSVIDYFKSSSFETFVMLSYQILFMLFTYALVLMINKQLLKDNAKQEEKFTKAFHASSTCMLLTRISDGMIFEVNDAFCKITGYSPAETIGKTTTELKLWNSSTDREKAIVIVNQSHSLKDAVLRFRKKNHELFWGLMSAEIITINGELCLISNITDITERKESEERLIEYANELKVANDTRDKLFSIIGHDLRSPFTTIVGFSELLKDEIDKLGKEQVRNYASLIHSSALNTVNLFNNLLDWSRLQQGKISFSPLEIHLKELTDELIELFQSIAQKKDIAISGIIPPDMKVIADDNMLKVIMRNLISNSLKFTHRGGTIRIIAARKDNEVHISITDSGIGMEAEKMKSLFDASTNHSSQGTDNEKGTGLGLLLSKEFVELHNGRIWAESQSEEVPVGSRFTFTLPITN